MTDGTDTDTSIQNRRPPKEFYSELDKSIGHQVKSREAYDRAIEIARSHGFSDFEISLFVKEYLKDKIPHSSLYRYINELKFPLGQIDSKNVLEDKHMCVTLPKGLHPDDKQGFENWMKIEDIKIGERIRKDPKLDAKPDLVKSIKLHGLIEPILVSKNNVLMKGLRRLEACKKLGWKIVPVFHSTREYNDSDNDKVQQILDQFHLNIRHTPTIEELRDYQIFMRKQKGEIVELYNQETGEKKEFIKDFPSEEIEYDWRKQINALLNQFFENHSGEPNFDNEYSKYERELEKQVELIEFTDIVNEGKQRS